MYACELLDISYLTAGIVSFWMALEVAFFVYIIA